MFDKFDRLDREMLTRIDKNLLTLHSGFDKLMQSHAALEAKIDALPKTVVNLNIGKKLRK